MICYPGVLDEGRGEKPMLDSNTVLTTPFGRPANVNNASPGVIFSKLWHTWISYVPNFQGLFW